MEWNRTIHSFIHSSIHPFIHPFIGGKGRGGNRESVESVRTMGMPRAPWKATTRSNE
jgi:hypothetical protein